MFRGLPRCSTWPPHLGSISVTQHLTHFQQRPRRAYCSTIGCSSLKEHNWFPPEPKNFSDQSGLVWAGRYGRVSFDVKSPQETSLATDRDRSFPALVCVPFVSRTVKFSISGGNVSLPSINGLLEFSFNKSKNTMTQPCNGHESVKKASTEYTLSIPFT